MNNTSSLLYTTWNCKYHIIFAPFDTLYLTIYTTPNLTLD